MNKVDDSKIERTMPVATRIDLVVLADLSLMMDRMGLRPNTMSGLVNSCVEIAHKACEDMGWLEQRCDGLSDAFYTLKSQGLIQASMYRRSRVKMQNAMAFENLRKEGINPKDYVPGQYNTMHKARGSGSVSASKMREIVESIEQSERDDIPVAGPVDEEEQKRKIDALKNPNYDPKVAQAETEKYNEEQRLIKESQRTAKLELARKRALAVEEGKIAITEEPSTAEVVDEVNKKSDDTPRQKTDEEVKADEERIADKDKTLMNELDSCKAPDATA